MEDLSEYCRQQQRLKMLAMSADRRQDRAAQSDSQNILSPGRAVTSCSSPRATTAPAAQQFAGRSQAVGSEFTSQAASSAAKDSAPNGSAVRARTGSEAELAEMALRLKESVTEIAELVRKATLHHQLLSGQYTAMFSAVPVRATLQAVIGRHRQVARLQDRIALTIAEEVPRNIHW